MLSAEVGKLMTELMNALAPADESEKRILAVVYAVSSYINENYKNKLLRWEIEKISGYCFDYTNKLFRKHIGTTIFRYYNTVKINIAKMQLLTTSKPIKEIAADVGFDDIYHFSKLFKSITGMSPAKMRNAGTNMS